MPLQRPQVRPPLHTGEVVTLPAQACGPSGPQPNTGIYDPPCVGNPGISYLDLLILIPGSRVISI